MLKKILIILSAFFMLFSCSEEDAGPDITPPDSVRNFKAEKEGTGDMLVELSWRQNPEKDLAGYLLYRKEGALNQYMFLDTVLTNEYVDTVNSYTTQYSYEIKAFDLAGNVSEGNKNASGITAPDFFAPKSIDLFDVTPINRGINQNNTISWSALDADIEYYNVIRETATDKNTIKVPNTQTTYVDTAVVVGTRYSYAIQAVDFATKVGVINTVIDDIILEKPVLVFPINDTILTDEKVLFTWNSVTEANSYELILNQDKDVLDTIILPVVGEKISFTIDLGKVKDIKAGMPISWRILTYSKPDGDINSSSDNAGNFYLK